MIRIELHCDSIGCERYAPVTVGSEAYFSGRPLKRYFPNGWRIRTPKGDDRKALAYCPQHASESLVS